MGRNDMTGLIRLHKWKLDEKRRNMGDLEKMRGELLANLKDLKKELVTEQKMAASSPIVSINYGGYAQQVLVRRENIRRLASVIEASSPPVVLDAPRSKQYQSPVGSASAGVGSSSKRQRSMKCSWAAELSLSSDAFHLLTNCSGVTVVPARTILSMPYHALGSYVGLERVKG